MERHPLLNAQLCHCTGAALFWVDAARFRPARAANLSPRRTLDGLPDDACWPAAHPAERFRSAADACPGNSPAFRYRRRFIRNHHELYQPPPLPTSGAHFIRLCRFGHRHRHLRPFSGDPVYHRRSWPDRCDLVSDDAGAAAHSRVGGDNQASSRKKNAQASPPARENRRRTCSGKPFAVPPTAVWALVFLPAASIWP